MRLQKTEAIIIKRKNFSEADRIITVFTKTQGKISVKASGVRRVKSRRGPHVELLNWTMLSLYNGHKFPILTEAETIEPFSYIKDDLKKTGTAFYICELVDGLCPENQENRPVFNLILQTLQNLRSKDHSSEVENFEITLLRLLGFWPHDKKLDEKSHKFVIESILERRLKTARILPLFDYPL